MRENVVLREFGSCELELSRQDYIVVRARYGGKIDIAPTEQSGVYRLTARDYVGRIGLPDGRVLVIEPKVEVSNLFYMLCADVGVASFYPQRVGLAEYPEIFPLILAAIVGEAEKLAAKGLYRDYYPREEALPFIKGQIALGAQISQYGELKHRHVCRYAELTLDTAENRVVAATLRYAAALLRARDDEVALRRTRDLLARFQEVTVLSRRIALTLLSRVKRHRLNAAYWPLLGLCGVVLNGLSLDERGGPHAFASFLVDMPRLFESFLTARLRATLPRYGLRVVAQRHDFLDVSRRVGIRPDVLVYSDKGTKPLLVLDAKYKQASVEGGGLNSDLYQVSAYMDRYGLNRGVLVYPQWERPMPGGVKLRGTPKELHIANLDLSAPNPAALDAECDRLASYVAALARP